MTDGLKVRRRECRNECPNASSCSSKTRWDNIRHAKAQEWTATREGLIAIAALVALSQTMGPPDGAEKRHKNLLLCAY